MYLEVPNSLDPSDGTIVTHTQKFHLEIRTDFDGHAFNQFFQCQSGNRQRQLPRS